MKKRATPIDVLRGKAVVLGNEKILENWSILIKNAKGKGEQIYEKTKKYIEEANNPDIEADIIKVIPKSTIGKRIKWTKQREYLRVRNKVLRDYRMYIGVRDYGNNLDVQWYLTCEPGFFRKYLSKALTNSDMGLSFALDVFQQQDLRAFATLVHHSLLRAVVELMSELNQDPSKIDRKSRGFLGIS